MYCNLKSHNFKANSESVNELWRFSQQAAFDSLVYGILIIKCRLLEILKACKFEIKDYIKHV